MFTAAADRSWLTEPFAPVSLRALDSKAGMMERIDNKYVVNQDMLAKAVPELSRHFDMLDIDGCRSFTYDTCYFDDEDCRSYFDHHQSRKKRIKVRMRKYLEAGLCFVEVKLKDKRGMTIKKRLRCDLDQFGNLDEKAGQFIQDVHFDLYRRPFRHEISRNLDMRYKRATLVAKDGGERMTIDNGLSFSMDGNERVIDPSLFVIEAKSAKGNGIADRILRGLHQHPIRHVSKYCTGLATMRDGTKSNNFRRAMRKLGLLETVPETPTLPVRKSAPQTGLIREWTTGGLALA